MNKFLVAIEFRYNGAPTRDEGYCRYISRTLTIGVFDSRDEANQAGNVVLVELEKQFKLNPNYNKKERFSNKGGLFGSPNDLITDSAYLHTPFNFFAKVTELYHDDVNDYIKQALKDINECQKWRANNEN